MEELLEYRTLGNSEMKVSVIGLGGNNFGERIDRETSLSVINRGLDLGINFIDTADSYGGGRSEIFIGEAIKNKRSSVIVATKFGSPLSTPKEERGGSRSYIMKAVEASLRRLNSDYIDLYYMHVPDSKTAIEETLRALDEVVKSGKARYIACSNFAAWMLCDALWTSKVNGLSSFVATQMNYNLIDRTAESELIPCSKKFGLGFIPYSPLAGGFLTGKYHKEEAPAQGTRFSAWKSSANKVWKDDNFALLQKFKGLAGKYNRSMTELAFAWLLKNAWLSSVIAGATSPEQVSGNVTAADWKLTVEQEKELESCLLPDNRRL
jgi:aryl-alcohol dehydrogenase-like predicted oxidoreductase